MLKSHPFHGIYRKAQIKVTEWEYSAEGKRLPVSLQFILKWGGELTDLGQSQVLAFIGDGTTPQPVSKFWT